jgi:hypothetical protein
VETLFKQIQDCVDYYEAGSVLVVHPKQINVGYAKIFATCHFMSAYSRWNEKPAAEKTWTQLKSHFAAAHRQHKQMHGGSAATAGYHSANAAVTQNEGQMAEATIGALANLATATAVDRGVVAALTQANSCLAKQLEDNSTELRELKALLNQERRDRRAQDFLTHWQAINVGHMATRLVRCTRASLATPPTQTQNRGNSIR